LGCPRQRRQERRLPHAAISPDWQPLRVPLWVSQARQGKHHTGREKALQFAGKVFLQLSAEALAKALQSGVLLEVCCEQDH